MCVGAARAVIELFAVLAQQVLAIVTAVWRAHYRMHVIAGRRTLADGGETAHIVELDQNNGAMDAILFDFTVD